MYVHTGGYIYSSATERANEVWDVPNGVLQHLTELFWYERNVQPGSSSFPFNLSNCILKENLEEEARIWRQTKWKASEETPFHFVCVVFFLDSFLPSDIRLPLSLLSLVTATKQDSRYVLSHGRVSVFFSRDWWARASPECLPAEPNSPALPKSSAPHSERTVRQSWRVTPTPLAFVAPWVTGSRFHCKSESFLLIYPQVGILRSSSRFCPTLTSWIKYFLFLYVFVAVCFGFLGKETRLWVFSGKRYWFF